MTADFQPMFISAGNADPLLPQSRAFAEAVSGLGVHVDSLFFPHDYSPALPHEYQFNLDMEAGQLALERSVQFLAGR
jgi:acetyl esterase/lipase